MSGMKATIARALPFTVTAQGQLQHRFRMARSRMHRRSGRIPSHGLKLELGSGPKQGTDGWITVDMDPACDLYWDLRHGIPFENGSVEMIYSQHLFEHLSFPQIQALLAECVRVLADGGTFSICVPNARLYIDAYLGLTEIPREHFDQWPPAYNNTTAIDALNYVAYMEDEHKYMFDEVNLLHILRSAGLRDATLRPFDPNLDSESRRYGSLHASARK